MAETGHLVLGTLHTNDTSQAVDRLVDVFPTGRQAQIRVQLANSLTGIIYQQLLPRIGGGQVAAFEVLVDALRALWAQHPDQRELVAALVEYAAAVKGRAA